MATITVHNRMSPRFAHYFKALLTILPTKIYREISNVSHDHSLAYQLKAGEYYEVGIFTANGAPVTVHQSAPRIVARGNTTNTVTITDAVITQLFGVNFGCPPVATCPGRWFSTQSADDLAFSTSAYAPSYAPAYVPQAGSVDLTSPSGYPPFWNGYGSGVNGYIPL